MKEVMNDIARLNKTHSLTHSHNLFLCQEYKGDSKNSPHLEVDREMRRQVFHPNTGDDTTKASSVHQEHGLPSQTL